ncbi:hypothetical protein ACFL57_00700 [Candidatus Margulisiibacteriota bacterium]
MAEKYLWGLIGTLVGFFIKGSFDYIIAKLNYKEKTDKQHTAWNEEYLIKQFFEPQLSWFRESVQLMRSDSLNDLRKYCLSEEIKDIAQVLSGRYGRKWDERIEQLNRIVIPYKENMGSPSDDVLIMANEIRTEINYFYSKLLSNPLAGSFKTFTWRISAWILFDVPRFIQKKRKLAVNSRINGDGDNKKLAN